MTTVLDASAVLAYLQGEAGAQTVESALIEGAVCGAANWSEVAQKIVGAGRDWELCRALLRSYELAIAPVEEVDAEWAALRWRRGEGLSLGDRLCLAAAERLDATVLTADAQWGSDGRIRQLR